MKIIGKGYAERYLVEMTEHELQKLTGYFYNRSGKPDYRVGTTVKISELYEQLTYLAAWEKSLQKTADRLRSLADLLLIFDPIIQEAAVVTEEDEE